MTIQQAVRVAEAPLDDRLHRHRPLGRSLSLLLSSSPTHVFSHDPSRRRALISSYRSNRPPEIVDLEWQAAIDVVQEAWDKTIVARGVHRRRRARGHPESNARARRPDKLLPGPRVICTRSWIYLGHFTSKVPSTNYLYYHALHSQGETARYDRDQSGRDQLRQGDGR